MTKQNKSIFFNLRNDSRQRMRDTAIHFQELGFDVHKPKFKKSFKDFELYTKRSKLLKIKIKRFIRKALPLLNIRKVNGVPNNEMLIYSWGTIPFNKNPYIVELDTPYSLSIYNIFSLRLFKFVLRGFLLSERCRKITCISEACRDNLRRELGEAVFQKSAVLYPFAESPDARQSGARKRSLGEPLKYLFIATQFRLKGGYELIEAFRGLKSESDKNVSLTIITNLSESEKEKFKEVEGLTILDARFEKKQLVEEVFPKHHVFVMPTYQDSFGLVFLEALSFGMPIVATNNYAIREMVHDDSNGCLITPPFYYYYPENLPNQKVWNTDIAARIEKLPLNREFVNRIKKGMSDCAERFEEFQENSKKIFKSKFSDEVRAQTIKRIFDF